LNGEERRNTPLRGYCALLASCFSVDTIRRVVIHFQSVDDGNDATARYQEKIE